MTQYVDDPHHHHARWCSVVRQFLPGQIAIRGHQDARAERRAEIVNEHKGFTHFGAIGLQPLANQQAEAVQAFVLYRRSQRSVDARNEHQLDNPQRSSDRHGALPREGERRRNPFTGRGRHAVTQKSRAAGTQRSGAGSVLHEDRCIHGARHARGVFGVA